ncbi:MAG: T9SS type B sorting domain-containing protein, partial [Paludibacteraceae bacterium]|nr:T9SS type B sorting domain-containing protein [Paludibacteraceae bacterium]
YHSREVTLEAGAGAAPYTIWYDNIPATIDNNTHFDNIPFGVHTMHVKDFYGCETSRIFQLDPPELVIKEFTTPNGDGVNDTWEIPGLAEVYPSAVVTIFDRYGKIVAQFFGADSGGWDGTYNGRPLPSTDYWYQIDIEEINRQYVGHFTLIRR